MKFSLVSLALLSSIASAAPIVENNALKLPFGNRGGDSAESGQSRQGGLLPLPLPIPLDVLRPTLNPFSQIKKLLNFQGQQLQQLGRGPVGLLGGLLGGGSSAGGASSGGSGLKLPGGLGGLGGLSGLLGGATRSGGDGGSDE